MSNIFWNGSVQDEYFTPDYAVDLIIPYLKKKGFKNILCPFDTQKSNFVIRLVEEGFNVLTNEGYDFFKLPTFYFWNIDAIVSNPPFSKKNEILEKLFKLNIPFALLLNLSGTLETKKRGTMWREYGIDLLIPDGRISYWNDKIKEEQGSPTFTSAYFSKGILPSSLEFVEMKKTPQDWRRFNDKY